MTNLKYNIQLPADKTYSLIKSIKHLDKAIKQTNAAYQALLNSIDYTMDKTDTSKSVTKY